MLITEREPGEIVSSGEHHHQHQHQLQRHQQQQQQAATTTCVSEETAPGLLSVPDQTPVASSSSSSSSSVMMVYHNSAVTDMGKPVRRRGRPPKLPVLSQLLSEKKPAHNHLHSADEQHVRMDVEPGSTAFILASIPTQPQPHPQQGFESSAAAFPTNVSDCSVTAVAAGIKGEPMEVTEGEVDRLHPGAGPEGGQDTGPNSQQGQGHGEDQGQDQRGTGVAGAGGGGVDGGGGRVAEGGGGEDRFQEASLETRFNILANQLGLEIGSPYHASLVYSQTPSAASHSANSALYQQMVLSSRSMVEMKPRRRQLSNLIKPSDDCVYTSFRIRPRNSGRRGGKRGGRKRGAGSKYDTLPSPAPGLPPSLPDDVRGKDGGYYPDREGGEMGSGGVGSAVITERIPGAGEVPQRLYQDLYHCKLCNELLPADSSVLHTCTTAAAPGSPPLRSCDLCGTMYLSPRAPLGGSGQPSVCEECSSKRQLPASPTLSPAGSVHDPAHHHHHHGGSEGFACQPCGVHFANIADYIQHRRSAHLEKMNRQPRKTHTLKTLPCPARGCPRLFHMQAELNRHVGVDHPEEVGQGQGQGPGQGQGQGQGGVQGQGQVQGQRAELDGVAASPSNCQPDSAHDVDVETVPAADGEETEAGEAEEAALFTCTQHQCGQRFLTPIDLLEHVQSAHEDVSHWPCPLPGCTRHFGAERHLRVHLLMHKEEKPLKCPFCKYRCRQKNALNWHVRKHPESTGHYRKFAGMAADS